jgi:hypothetical protein
VSSVSGSELTGSSGTRYSPSAHLARSSSWQRWLQNGRQAGSIGRWRQYTQTAPALGGIRPFYLAHAGRSKGGQTGSATTAAVPECQVPQFSAVVPPCRSSGQQCHRAPVQGSSATVPQFRAVVPPCRSSGQQLSPCRSSGQQLSQCACSRQGGGVGLMSYVEPGLQPRRSVVRGPRRISFAGDPARERGVGRPARTP